MNDHTVTPDTISFFSGLIFACLVMTYDRMESERMEAASARYHMLRNLVRVLSVCSFVGLLAVTFAAIGQIGWWAWASDVGTTLFFATVLCSIYVVITFLRRTF